MSKRKSPLKVISVDSENDLVQSLGDLLKRLANEASTRQGQFYVGLSGGSMVKLLTKALIESDLDTSLWLFFFCDERYVPENSEHSTYHAYKKQWANELPSIRDEQFIKANTLLDLDSCAEDYEVKIRTEVPKTGSLPQFDLLLLGMGPDGHTCSLFPEQPESLRQDARLVIPIRNSPKPPPERITFTLPLINNARHVAFVVTGAEKATVVQDVFVHVDKTFPSAWVDPENGDLTLIVDENSGKYVRSLSS
ncbi:probable 6-phosphogluconolactonase [Drosophila bipectinata]|uniref:probable 6-phosphogluconolactonase n=1 Tax=Drosophila bipectinata TaxID=42026 RepID=UPI001C8AB0AE|nr:probable 6-phosphogluconolactonase [Drosophila bipectinata]